MADNDDITNTAIEEQYDDSNDYDNEYNDTILPIRVLIILLHRHTQVMLNRIHMRIHRLIFRIIRTRLTLIRKRQHTDNT